MPTVCSLTRFLYWHAAAFNKLPDQHVTTAALDKATHALAKLGLIAAAARHS